MLFTFLLVDRAGAGELRLQHRPAHRAYLAEVADRICVAGPLLADDGETMTGSLLVIDFESRDAAHGVAARRALHPRRRLRAPGAASVPQPLAAARGHRRRLSPGPSRCASSSSTPACRASSSAPARCSASAPSSTARPVAGARALDAGAGAARRARRRHARRARAGVFAQARDARADRDRARGVRRSPRGSAPTARWRSAAARRPASARRSRFESGPARSSPMPTTYAGSEMTSIYGLTEGGREEDRPRSARAAAHASSTTPSCRWRCRSASTVTSVMNAIAHAAEGLYAHDGNPIVDADGRGGHPRSAPRRCRGCRRDPRDLEARGDALYGAWLCGTVLGSVAMGLHHKLCHTLGGSFDLPHAEVHTVVLPHALAYNAAAAPEAMQTHRARARRAGGRAAAVFDLRATPRRAGLAEGHRHAGRRPGPGGRPGGAEPVPEPAAARARRDSARCCSAPSTGDPPDEG